MQPQDSVELQDERTGILRKNHEEAGINQRGNQIQSNKLKRGQTVDLKSTGLFAPGTALGGSTPL